ncbi:hypothetical protein, partial [Mesorhizobium sp. M1272]|uniref:hypothetical protein n=1 Tax=Mesorhizobium sp. M1272 TaxID=2957074 RepID=UPI003339A059
MFVPDPDAGNRSASERRDGTGRHGCGGVSALPWVNNPVGDGRDRIGNQVVAERPQGICHDIARRR